MVCQFSRQPLNQTSDTWWSRSSRAGGRRSGAVAPPQLGFTEPCERHVCPAVLSLCAESYLHLELQMSYISLLDFVFSKSVSENIFFYFFPCFSCHDQGPWPCKKLRANHQTIINTQGSRDIAMTFISYSADGWCEWGMKGLFCIALCHLDDQTCAYKCLLKYDSWLMSKFSACAFEHQHFVRKRGLWEMSPPQKKSNVYLDDCIWLCLSCVYTSHNPSGTGLLGLGIQMRRNRCLNTQTKPFWHRLS